MKKITNSSELSKYYSEVNKFIDEYIKLYKVTPSEIYRYINKNLSRFLNKFNLTDIENIERIVKDVIEHRKNMERDKIFKFEQFNTQLNESIIEVGSVTIEHEKILADYFNTSLGHIDVIDPNLHLFEIKDFDQSVKSIVFSNEEVKSISDKLIDRITDELSSMEVSLNSIDGQSLINPFDFLLGSIVSESQLKSNIQSKLNGDKLIEVITTFIPSIVHVEYSSVCRFQGISNGFYIWTL